MGGELAVSYVHMPQLYVCVFEFPIQLGCKGLNSKTSDGAVSRPMPSLSTPCNLRYLMTRSRKHPPGKLGWWMGHGGKGMGMGMGNGVVCGEVCVGVGEILVRAWLPSCSKA